MTLTAKLDRYTIFGQVSTGRPAGISFFWCKLGAQFVVWFEPIGSESNVSSYLQWAIPISNITVGNLRVLRFYAHAAVGRSGTEPLPCNPRMLKKIPTTLWRCSTCERFPNVYFSFARPPLLTEVLLGSSVPTKT